MLFNNTCRNNRNGIGVYSNEVGPVANNYIIGNVLKNNMQYGLTSGAIGHEETKISLQNTFASNFIAGNAWDQADPDHTAQVNPAHGATTGDYYTNNIIKGSDDAGLDRYDLKSVPSNVSSLAIFEPEIE